MTEREQSISSFIQSHGGQVRFDHYMQEHLFNPTFGFYNTSLIGSCDEGAAFLTFSHMPLFADFIDYYIRMGREEKSVSFLEIGGGMGALKKELLTRNSSLNYISVDSSSHFCKLQKLAGPGEVYQSSVVNLPFSDDSIEGIVFSNELFDALACRVFKITNSNSSPIISQEGYITQEGDKRSLTFENIIEDDFTLTYQTYLQTYFASIPDGSVRSISDQSIPALKEMGRILKKGEIVIIDYGSSYSENQNLHLPFFKDVSDGSCKFLDDILSNPYTVDITHNVDFEFLLFSAANQKYNSVFSSQTNFFRKLLRIKIGFDEDVVSLLDHPNYPYLFSENDFKILILQK